MKGKWSDINFKSVNEEAMYKGLTAASMYLVGKAKAKCIPDTGRLRNSITYRVYIDKKMAEVGTNVEYAQAVEYGTRPHKIRPHGKYPLVWKKDGEKRAAWSVNHPGTKAQPFMRPAVDEGAEDILRIYKKYLAQTLQKAASRGK
jgi:HK97 gp10 family phage protein